MTNKERAEELFHKYAAPRRVGHVELLTIGTCDVEKIIEAERRATITACLEIVAGEKAIVASVLQEVHGKDWEDVALFDGGVYVCERIATRLKQLEEQP